MEIPNWTLTVKEYKNSFHIIMFHKDRERLRKRWAIPVETETETDRQTETDWLTDWLTDWTLLREDKGLGTNACRATCLWSTYNIDGMTKTELKIIFNFYFFIFF